MSRAVGELDLNTFVVKNKQTKKPKPQSAPRGSDSGLGWTQMIHVLWDVCELLAMLLCLQRTAVKTQAQYLAKVR